MKITHILVTTDLSSEALRPCEPVADLARSHGARITVLHVLSDYLVVPHGAPFAPGLSAPDLPNSIADARAELDQQRGAFGEDLDVQIDVISGSDIARSVALYAKENGVDLITLSTHGRTGFRHLVLGSIAEAILRHSPVPVLVFPQKVAARIRSAELTPSAAVSGE